jgi:ketosteroid isomerase-like protein
VSAARRGTLIEGKQEHIIGTQADDEAQILRLDDEWNEAYRRRDRSPLAHILADDFTGWTAVNEPITKALLMINPPSEQIKSVTFSEQFVSVFGATAISRGRLQLEMEDGRIVTDQRFLRVFAKRDGIWQAVSVAVTPLA